MDLSAFVRITFLSAIFLTAPPGFAGTISLDSDSVIRQYHFYDVECRGGAPDRQETFENCGARIAYGEILLSAGYCFENKPPEMTPTWVKGAADDEGFCK